MGRKKNWKLKKYTFSRVIGQHKSIAPISTCLILQDLSEFSVAGNFGTLATYYPDSKISCDKKWKWYKTILDSGVIFFSQQSPLLKEWHDMGQQQQPLSPCEHAASSTIYAVHWFIETREQNRILGKNVAKLWKTFKQKQQSLGTYTIILGQVKLNHKRLLPIYILVPYR